MKKIRLEEKSCKRCGKDLPIDWQGKYCERCQNLRIGRVKKLGSAALGLVTLVVNTKSKGRGN